MWDRETRPFFIRLCEYSAAARSADARRHSTSLPALRMSSRPKLLGCCCLTRGHGPDWLSARRHHQREWFLQFPTPARFLHSSSIGSFWYTIALFTPRRIYFYSYEKKRLFVYELYGEWRENEGIHRMIFTSWPRQGGEEEEEEDRHSSTAKRWTLVILAKVWRAIRSMAFFLEPIPIFLLNAKFSSLLMTDLAMGNPSK